MGTIDCKEFLNHVEPWMDGERHPDARAHARDCARCRGLVEDFGAIQIAARDLSTIEEEPAPHVWTLLRAQLEQEGLIRNRRTGWFQGLFGAIPRPALAGAYLAILIAAAVALSALCSPARFISNAAHSAPPCQTSQRVRPSSWRRLRMRQSAVSEKP